MTTMILTREMISSRPQQHKEMQMTHINDVINFIDELILDKARRKSDGLYLSFHDLDNDEIATLIILKLKENEEYISYKNSIQEIIDERCAELHKDFIRSRDFDE